MFGLGVPEILILLLAFAVLFFGSGKILDFARSLGRMSGEFKKSKMDIERELKTGEGDSTTKEKEKEKGKNS